MKVVLVLLVVFYSLTGVANAAEKTLKVVTFGTSLTHRGGWQDPLQQALQTCLGRPVDIKIVARSGSTSDWAVASLQSVIAENPDVVLIEFYANDAALNRLISVGYSRANMEKILDTLQSRLPNARLVMMVMNPMSGLRGMLRPFLNSYITAHEAAAKARGVEILDHTAAWSALSGDDLDSAIPDGIHPVSSVVSAVIVPGIVKKLAPDCIAKDR